jgi:hypothetical protein
MIAKIAQSPQAGINVEKSSLMSHLPLPRYPQSESHQQPKCEGK